ncbi:MAG: AAA family ATPase [Defluviicoccus sp.]|nr:AAA family ATPase [Defluviicoccus sp.]MDE0276166.1 AAA family ATPase [Defluviicoccus sp.]
MIAPDEFLLEDVRCFRGEQRARLRPITLLVGENSTGKTTFLGCYDVLHRLLAGSRTPGDRLDFNREPFSMGSFREIVRSRRGRLGRIDEFALGFSVSSRPRADSERFLTRVGFSEGGAQPTMSSVHCEYGNHAFSLRRTADSERTVFKTAEFETEVDYVFDENWMYWLNYLSRGRKPNPDESENENRVIDYLAGTIGLDDGSVERQRFFMLWSEQLRIPIPVAPLRSKPKRTYDPVRETASPEGGHIPMLMMRLDRTDKGKWGELHGDLVTFGKASGMFADIAVKRHGRQMSDPFQLQVKVRTGPQANIMDVGYGVSQSLPILVDVRSQTHSVLLLQQPEVHLHPRAQAELASLFVASYKKNHNHFMIETHSDYIIDRIRILVKKQVLSPDDVSILYFAPKRNAVKIHNIGLDGNGDLEGVPEGYRDFFIRESDQLLGFAD